MTTDRSTDVGAFLDARDFLLAHRDRTIDAYAQFQWPRLDRFNWALDYFEPSRAATTDRAPDRAR